MYLTLFILLQLNKYFRNYMQIVNIFKQIEIKYQVQSIYQFMAAFVTCLIVHSVLCA